MEKYSALLLYSLGFKTACLPVFLLHNHLLSRQGYQHTVSHQHSGQTEFGRSAWKPPSQSNGWLAVH